MTDLFAPLHGHRLDRLHRCIFSSSSSRRSPRGRSVSASASSPPRSSRSSTRASFPVLCSFSPSPPRPFVAVRDRRDFRLGKPRLCAGGDALPASVLGGLTASLLSPRMFLLVFGSLILLAVAAEPQRGPALRPDEAEPLRRGARFGLHGHDHLGRHAADGDRLSAFPGRRGARQHVGVSGGRRPRLHPVSRGFRGPSTGPTSCSA